MTTAKDIEKFIKETALETKTEMNEVVRNRIFRAFEKSKQTKSALIEQNIWRIIMKSKITKLAAAAVIIIAAVLLITILDKSATPAYGITDVPELLKKAKTLHIKGCVFFPDPTSPDKNYRKLELDYWFDVENGRYRLYKPGGIDKDTGEPKYYPIVSDGQFVMNEIHHRPLTGQTWKSISFTKLSPYQARLQTYRSSYQFLMRMFGSGNQIQGTIKVGQEEIDGTVFDIWQNEFYLDDGRGTKIRTWLVPNSGKIGRILFWHKKQKDEPNWRPYFDFDTIELDIVPPPKIFSTKPPDGYKLDNTKETAHISTLGISPHYRFKVHDLHLHIGFTLSDGSVILGWSCQGKVESSIADLDMFKDLVIGGKLPDLSVKIVGLKPIPRQFDINYSGHHLAYTQKDGNFYEWSLYVPDSQPPERNSLFGYEVNIKFEVDKKKVGTWPRNLSEDLTINSSDDFNTWIHGAMAEFSDDGKAPEGVTYESVLQLARRIRKSLNK
jgi:hypothetical protein